MTLAITHSRALDGLHAPPVTVEVHLASGLPSFSLVGLPDTEVKEARERVRAAIVNAGFEFPGKRITVNLAPADLPKESGRFDLPIALAILAASGQITSRKLANHEFAGELSLSGALRPIRGALAMALETAQSQQIFVLPKDSAQEASLSGHPHILGATSLLEVCAYLNGQGELPPPTPVDRTTALLYGDLNEVRGQTQAKRALAVAAGGLHSLLMIGPPGTGKSMLASRLPGLLPPLSPETARESAAVFSLLGQFKPGQFGQRPFRNPHHTASAVALVGGGNPPRPGEISLAHQGILFLDELTEFDRHVLETLREPLESGRIHIARAARHAEFPARFQLVAAMNPCPCGMNGHPANRCRCTPDQISRYRGKLSGPFMDRLDLFIEVPALPADALLGPPEGPSSAEIRDQVSSALAAQQARQGKSNAQLSPGEIDTVCPLSASGRQLLTQAMQRLHLSARASHRILKVARTIADLAGRCDIENAHLAEAIQYRRLAQAHNV